MHDNSLCKSFSHKQRYFLTYIAPCCRSRNECHPSGQQLLVYCLLPADLDHTNVELRESLVDWMNCLREVYGFRGWRFDFVRGYAPTYTAE
jgi:hypothetical protein